MAPCICDKIPPIHHRLLAIRGRHDAFFVPAGAEAFRRDLPNANMRFLETEHFALETDVEEIGDSIRVFLQTAHV
jgi:pimeloyl-ACP methyl ester carboxylesterase